MDVENIDPLEDSPPSPPSPVAQKNSRRSSIAAARRMSRASTMGGAMFEELLSAIPSREDSSTAERLEKLIKLSVSSSLRTTLESLKDDDDEQLEDSAGDVAKTIRLSSHNQATLNDIVKMIDEGVEIDGDVVGGELKKMKEYSEQLEAEGVMWKELIAERKEMFRNADRNCKAVQSGEITISDDVQWSLTGEERLKMKKLTELSKAAVAQLSAGVNESSEVQIRSIATFSKQQDMMLQENNEKLCQAVTQLTKRADDFNSEL